ncbi:MAG: DUF3604 domain-containing protein [Firmicutes bacterium]|nr:DUF3604 domain-containing protein [Bacillota bacterium]
MYNKYGRAEFTPSSLVVGTKATISLIYTVGKSTICPGGGIKCGFLHRENFPLLQIDDPTAGNYIFAICSRPETQALVVKNRLRNDFEYTEFTVITFGASLSEGDTITVIFKEFDVPLITHNNRVLFWVDVDGSRNYNKLGNPPILKWVADKPNNLVAYLPSEALVNDRFYLHVKVMDQFGNPATSYRGTIKFSCDQSGLNLPEPYTFTAADGGVHHFASSLYAQQPGWYRITIIDEENNLRCHSNFIRVGASNPEFNRYWGVIHGQTLMSDGLATPDLYYHWGRDVEKLDVCSATDHDTHATHREIGGGGEYITTPFWQKPDDPWAILRYEADRFYEPGKFVTLLGYEWTSGHCFTPEGMGFGHKNIYYLNDDGPMYSHIDPESNTPAKLYNLLRYKDAIVVPHHTSRPVNPEGTGHPNPLLNRPVSGNDWRYHDPEKERLVEIYSHWGNSELHGGPRPVIDSQPGGYVQEALVRGYKLGFIAGSDTHKSRPGGYVASDMRYPQGGLTCFLARNLTREGIFDSMYARRCYATTIARIYLDVRVNNLLMGEETRIQESDCKERCVQVTVAGTDDIDKIEIIRNNRNVYMYQGDGPLAEFTWTDTDDLKGILFQSLVDDTQLVFYYVRVTQRDGEMAWSSPVWFQIK